MAHNVANNGTASPTPYVPIDASFRTQRPSRRPTSNSQSRQPTSSSPSRTPPNSSPSFSAGFDNGSVGDVDVTPAGPDRTIPNSTGPTRDDMEGVTAADDSSSRVVTTPSGTLNSLHKPPRSAPVTGYVF